jgi:hypothetical protein
MITQKVKVLGSMLTKKNVFPLQIFQLVNFCCFRVDKVPKWDSYELNPTFKAV